ncbi:MAG: hypothetical protein H6772_01985 [Pseudomonadales bacterium]|nr:hypothetical protein [Pseudomonadales bacterium]
MISKEEEVIQKTLITPYRINTHIANYCDHELFESEIQKTQTGTKAEVHITNGEPPSSADYCDVNATVSRGFQKEIDGIHYSVDEMRLTPNGKNQVLVIEVFNPIGVVPIELAVLTQRRTVARTDKPAKIVLKIYRYEGKEVSVIDYVSNRAEIQNSPYSPPSFLVTDEEKKLMELLEMKS